MRRSHQARYAALVAATTFTLVMGACSSAGHSSAGSHDSSQPPNSTIVPPSPGLLASPMPSLPKGVTKAIPVGLGPNGATFAFGSVWVADHHDGSVSRVDPKTGKTIATIPAGAGPGYVSPGFGSIWVTDYFENAISRINPKTNKSVHINLGDNHGPGNTGCSAIAAFGSVWVGDGFDVLRVDPATDKVVGATKVGHDPNALPCVIQQGGGLVWTHGPGNKIYGLDSKGRLAKVLPFVNITFGNGKEWVEQETPDLAGRVIALDPRTEKRLSVTSIAYPGDGVNDNMITSPGRVWIKNVTTSTLYGIDATTGRIVTKVDMNGLLAGMPAFAYGSVWLPIFDQNVLWTVDAS